MSKRNAGGDPERIAVQLEGATPATKSGREFFPIDAGFSPVPPGSFGAQASHDADTGEENIFRDQVAVALPCFAGIVIAFSSSLEAKMSSIKRILAPVDFSESSVRAARGAAAWAKHQGSELHLLHVIPDAIHDRAFAELAELSLPTLEDWTRGTRDALDALAARLPVFPVHVRTAVRLGQPAAEITAYAAEQEMELIVMSSKGHGSVARLLLGSVAEKVVREAACPVLTIPGDVDVTRWSEDREGLVKSMTLRTIVALTDFSDISREAVIYAHDVAAHLGATLHVLHVVAPPWPQLAYVPPPTVHAEEIRWRAERWLMRVVERLKGAGDIVTATRLGKPADGAIAYADEVSADVMVLATHGRGAINRLLLGSVAQNVLRQARCPILTVNQTWCDASIAFVRATSRKTV